MTAGGLGQEEMEALRGHGMELAARAVDAGVGALGQVQEVLTREQRLRLAASWSENR